MNETRILNFMIGKKLSHLDFNSKMIMFLLMYVAPTLYILVGLTMLLNFWVGS